MLLTHDNPTKSLVFTLREYNDDLHIYTYYNINPPKRSKQPLFGLLYCHTLTQPTGTSLCQCVCVGALW